MERITKSRAFVVWRWVYFALLLLVSVPASVIRDPCVGPELGYYLLALGVAPSACFLLLSRVRPRWAGAFALAYDALVLLAFCVGLAMLPNYFGLILLSPLAAFAIEGLVLSVLLVARRG